jgi:hypothetical protein
MIRQKRPFVKSTLSCAQGKRTSNLLPGWAVTFYLKNAFFFAIYKPT